jgi:hypothetical protein
LVVAPVEVLLGGVLVVVLVDMPSSIGAAANP